MNFFNQGIPLGRWFRIMVIIHWTFLLYAANELFGGSAEERGYISYKAIYLALLFGTVLIHEFGHALACRAVGGQAEQIILWPLGGIAFVQPPMNPRAWLITTVCGPLVNAIFWPLFWALSKYWLPEFLSTHNGEAAQYLAFGIFIMAVINKSLLLFNLIPAYPMDGGRILQEILWFIVGYKQSLIIAGMVGTVAGGALVVLGIGQFRLDIPFIDFSIGGELNPMLIIIGILAATQSFALYRQGQLVQSWRKN